jgi:hypothetical protein
MTMTSQIWSQARTSRTRSNKIHSQSRGHMTHGRGRSLDLRDSAATLRLCHGCYHEIWRDSTVVTGLLACTKSYSDFVLPIPISDSFLVVQPSALRELPNLKCIT